jgi:hypothetical protein
MKALIAGGVESRIFSVRPAQEMMDFTFAQIPGWEKLATITRPASRKIAPKDPADLAWRRGPGPGYSEEKAKTVLENRYRHSTQIIALSWPRMMADPRTRALFLNLRAEGALDWQILAIASNLVGQYQVEQALGGRMTSEGMQLYYSRMKRREEPNDAPFDLSLVTPKSLQDHSMVLIRAVCQTWGLTSHVATPVFAGLKRLLDERYGNATDDVPHDDPFAWDRLVP